MSASSPLVSIVIPSFNQGKFIEQTIESVLAQDYFPLEILVIDAGSTDNTIEILHKYDSIPELTWISEPDKGHADGVNKGISKVKGEIMAWLNSDDVYYSRSTVNTVVRSFQNYPNIDVIYGDSAVISDDSKLLRFFLLPRYSKNRIERGNYISQPAVFFRTRVVKSQKLDGSLIGLDYEYWMRLGVQGFTFFHINVILAADRHYSQRLSVLKKDLINSQMEAAKIRFGFSNKHNRFLYLFDRSAQAVCRIKGLILISLMPFYWERYKKNLAFPVKIDSHFKLFFRQLTKTVGSNTLF
jgi:glycosyltransferase involved in cell wall biosynthesis